VENLGETDSGDPQVLLNFVSWVKSEYPADHYALILWNHGGGWAPLDLDRLAQKVGAKDYSDREATERAATPIARTFFRTTLQKIFSLPTARERAICCDDGTGHSLDTVELGNVLKQTHAILGQPLDLLGMDACLMSNLEVAYQVRKDVRYVVASEESEPNAGWPYDAVLKKLTAAPDTEAKDLAAHIVKSYVKSYVDVGFGGAVTQAGLDLSRMDDLQGPLDALADALIQAMPAARTKIWTAQVGSAHFYNSTLWDIAHFGELLPKGWRAPAVRDAAKAVRAALKQGAGKFIISEAHHGPGVSRCRGLTIYLITQLTRISPYYANLAFAKERRWLDLLKAYHGV
jgi:hypothetical protein